MHPLPRNLGFRTLFIVLALLPIFFINDVFMHFKAHFAGGIIDTIITQEWHLVIINIIIFMSFLIPLSYRRKIDWKEYGLVTAFFVSLFVEMYGIPLTVYLASRFFAGAPASPATPVGLEIGGVHIGMTITMLYASILMLIGTAIIVLGWLTLYRNLDEGLVTKGIYAHSRHPQYLGFLVIVIAWFIGWPTFLTLVFAPILVYKYIDVCRKEEEELASPEYQVYREATPFLL